MPVSIRQIGQPAAHDQVAEGTYSLQAHEIGDCPPFPAAARGLSSGALANPKRSLVAERIRHIHQVESYEGGQKSEARLCKR